MSLLSDYKALTMTNHDRPLWAQKSPDEILDDVDAAIVADGITAIEDRRAVFHMLDLDFSKIEARIIPGPPLELVDHKQQLWAGADFGTGRDEGHVLVFMGGRRLPGKSRLRDGLLHINLEMCEAQVRQRIEALLQRERELSIGYKILSHDEAGRCMTPAKAEPVKPKGAQWKRERKSFGRSCK